MPATYPLSLNTKGNESTPEPIADAHNAKILPLRLPLSSFENVRLRQSRGLFMFGDKNIDDGLTSKPPASWVLKVASCSSSSN